MLKLHCVFLVNWVTIFLINAQSIHQKLSTDAFFNAIQKDAIQLLDVRTKTEFDTEYIANALHADWYESKEFKHRIHYLDTLKPVYIYCQTGIRSHKAAIKLTSMGYNVYELDGGLIMWKQANYPLILKEKINQLTENSYLNLIPKEGYALVDFGAKWCPPCIKIKPQIDSLAQNYASVLDLIKIDGGTHTDILKTLKINAFPTFILYKDGIEIWRHTGVISNREILAQIE